MKTKRVLKKIAALSTGVAMLGATLTGALAVDYTLADYPTPFVTNGVFSGLLVVGANAAASDTIGQSVILSDLQTKAVTPVSGGGSISVAGGVTEDIPLGSPIADAQSYTLDQELQDDDIDNLIDTAISFSSSDYDISEDLVLGQAGNNVTVETSLTSSEDDYQTDVVLEIARDAIKYYYVFDEKILLSSASTTTPLSIKFLGKTLKITDTNAGNTTFTATIGTEYFMEVDDSVEVLGKTVTLKNVGSDGNIVIDVDGVTETVGSTAETVNGIEVKVDDTFYSSNDKTERSASIILGKDATETYKDGDAYVGEDTDDPDWVWNFGNINDNSVATTTSTTAEFSGPYLGVENDFIYNDDSDNPPTVGECVDLPNNYLSVCLDSLTVADSNYATYTFEFDNSADLSDADGQSAAATVYIHTAQSEGLVVNGDQLTAYNGTAADTKTEHIWLRKGNETDVFVYYKDTNTNKVVLAGAINNDSAGQAGSNGFARINYDNTKDSDIYMYLEQDEGSGTNTDINLTLVPYDSTNLPNYDDNITMFWGVSSTNFASLGDTLSSEEADEIVWGSTQRSLGTKDEDHRTRYGIIIRDPKARGSSDEVVLEIPGDQVQANVIVKGSAATTSTTGGSVRVNPIPASVAVLDTEVTSASAQNVIVVGGPAVNSLASSVFGLNAADFTPNEAMIKLMANGEKMALLVAGYEAVDTRNAADAVATGKLAGKAKAEVVVKSTQLNEYSVE